MDIQIQLLEKFTLRVQPFFTVGQLKDLIAEKIDLEHPDVHLLFNDALLEENWLTLSSVGLVPGSLVTALSKDLARYKAGQSQVRSVEEAFTTIADERLVGAKAEADALERSTPFSIFCSRFALIELGPGWPLFFDFVIFLGVLLFLVVLIQIAVFVEFGASYNIGLWPLGENEPIGQWMTSAGNYGPDGSSSCTTGICCLVCSLVLVVGAAHYSYRLHYLKRKMDASDTSPDDYALFVRGLPEDVTEEEVARFVASNARSGTHTDVVKVVLAFDLQQHKVIREEYKDNLARLQSSTDEPTKTRLRTRNAQLMSSLGSPDALRQFVPCTGYAVVLLRLQSDHRECLAEWSSSWEQLLGWLHLEPFLSALPLFRGEHALRITRAASPTDMLWENMSATLSEKVWRRMLTNVIGTLIVAVFFGIVVGLNFLEDALGGSQPASILPALGQMISGPVTAITFRRLVVQEYHLTKTGRDTALVFKLSFSDVIMWLVVPLVCNLDSDTNWYRNGGLVQDIFWLIVVMSIVYPLTIGVGLPQVVKRLFASFYGKPKPGMTQATLNKIYEPLEESVARRFMTALRIFMVSLVFTPIFPLGAVIGFVALILFYWTSKWSLLRYSKRPYRQSANLVGWVIRLVYVGAFMFAGAAWIFLNPSLTGAGEQFVQDVGIAFLVIAAFMAMLPHTINRLLSFAWIYSFFCPRRSGLTTPNYYEAQHTWPKHQKYHTTNQVYLVFERLTSKQMEKGVPGASHPWDPRTGNFTDPRGSVPGFVSETEPAGTTPAPGRLGPAAFEPDSEADLGVDAVEETSAIAEEDPAALALEEMKYKVPVASVRSVPKLSLLGGESSSEYGDEPEKALLSRKGVTTLRTRGFTPGMLVSVTGLESDAGQQYNDTQARVLGWNPLSEKWNVKLFTGVTAAIPAKNLQPV